MNDLNNINTAIASLNAILYGDKVILYGDKSFSKETNCKILTKSMKFLKDTQILRNLSFNVYKSSLNYYS